jgi:GTPase SAR1 family protein
MIEERYFSEGNEPKYKIIKIGDLLVSKTTLFWRYIEGESLAESPPTSQPLTSRSRRPRSRATPSSSSSGTAGQEKYQAIVPTCFNGCRGIMVMFDLSKPQTFLNATIKWY